jgi:hypothetical protein
MAIIHEVLEYERSGPGELCFGGNKSVAIIVYLSNDFCLSTIPIIIVLIIKECGLSTILIILKFLPRTI